ncbi:MAG: bifunctional pyr operon transcriptional regulator/uracil phosphoribosyltransferase PyrR [Bacteroidota bacterium]|nr:bifunctional pyr operon transcriptional regulator/uracil phosphoribosyltransferase PyrR [Bacteroidota bacterium]
MKIQRKILDSKHMSLVINRLCRELIENHHYFEETVLVGVQPRGTFLSERISRKINSILNISSLQLGMLDISFYRDDFRRRENPIEPQSIDMNFSIESKNVVLIDDVLYTGRSVRAAIDALMAFGRPKKIELLILIDRRFSRHLPIQPNYVGSTIDVIDSEKVVVEWKEKHGKDQVIMKKNNYES